MEPETTVALAVPPPAAEVQPRDPAVPTPAPATELPLPAPLTLAEIGPIAGLGPEALLGLEPEQAAAVLGRPTAVAERPPATVWEYAGNTCTLSLLFYRDLNNDRSRALGYDFSPDAIAPEARARCIAAIRAARN